MAPLTRPFKSLHSPYPRNEEKVGGLDRELLLKISKNVRPNAITGHVETEDFKRYMFEHLDSPDVQCLLSQANLATQGLKDVDVSRFDFTSLGPAVVPKSSWWIKLSFAWLVDAEGRTVDPEVAHTVPGVQQLFTLSCHDLGDDVERLVQDVHGLPKSSDVLKFIQRCIAAPFSPFLPALPNFLLLSIKLQPHIATLAPFLDTLPAPFAWKVESPRLAQTFGNISYAGEEFRFRAYTLLSQKAKKAGDDAFGAKDRAVAVKAYGEALDHLDEAMRESHTEEQEQNTKRLIAICLSDRAAAYMLEGEGMEPALALSDAEEAEEADPSHLKAYHRQAKALQLLGEHGKAREVIKRALKLTKTGDSK
ncbi:hypothetical protein BV25DRAFT_1836074 [Artomyces pyxidatus]|uniref:Uncharacterized protein n=1 Tax=Artomyces pyxidatus TaxID=48021 RepID=A0ACB8TC64_9AGAM|nr:hypothetical protein BV25DRAFT_1836074 [Artomyces pyxidatus]